MRNQRTYYPTRDEAKAVFEEVTGLALSEKAVFKVDPENASVGVLFGAFPEDIDAPDAVVWFDEVDVEQCRVYDSGSPYHG